VIPMSTEHAVNVRDTRLTYREAGAGRPLVLVHGNFGSKRWFSEQLASPPPGWRLLAPDLPNFGHSQPMREEISIAAYAAYLAAFCDELGLKRIALLGHSLGGAVAQAFAVRLPERLSHLILVSSVAPDGHTTSPEHYQVLEGMCGNRQALGQALAATMPARRPPYFDGIVDDALAMNPACFSGNGRALERFDVRSETHAVQAPVLVLRGDLDLPHLITEEIARRTAASYRRTRLELWQGVGHSPQIEAPERFNELLTSFLKEST
jgi:pimeloyl-ACP methyl ester carboxylesterase